MSAEGEARRARLGPDTVRAAQQSAASAPEPSQELVDQIALLLRTLRRRPTEQEQAA